MKVGLITLVVVGEDHRYHPWERVGWLDTDRRSVRVQDIITEEL